MNARILCHLAPIATLVAGMLSSVAVAQSPPRSRYAGALEPLEAQRRAEASASDLDLTAAARQWLIGLWRSNTDGNFVLQFMADGTYLYSHKDEDLRQVAEHAGTWVIGLSTRRSESSVAAISAGAGAWPAIDGKIGRPAEGAGLMVSMRPQRIGVASSAAPIYLGDRPASFRIAFSVERGGQHPDRFRMLHIDQGPSHQSGQLRFRRER